MSNGGQPEAICGGPQVEGGGRGQNKLAFVGVRRLVTALRASGMIALRRAWSCLNLGFERVESVEGGILCAAVLTGDALIDVLIYGHGP